MSNEKMREEFEAWHFGEVDRLANQVGIDTAARFNESMEDRWPSWQASRAAIEVELPSSARIYFNGAPAEAYTDGIKCWHGGVDACRVAIESAGLKVKP